MELEEYEVMYRVEDQHWWYRGMQAITTGVLDRFVGRGNDRTILDAGCGTGAVMHWLAPYGRVTGVDLSPAALSFCRQRGHDRLVNASITELPFASGVFDLITSFDVVSECGLELEPRAFAEFARVLKPGGRVLLRLPAYDWLRGQHDQKVHTRHRYTRPELRKKLAQHGFAMEKASYANCALFPLALVKRLSEKWFPPKQSGSDLTIDTGLLSHSVGDGTCCRRPGWRYTCRSIRCAR
jgi:SAM-dependent methyltransferase